MERLGEQSSPDRASGRPVRKRRRSGGFTHSEEKRLSRLTPAQVIMVDSIVAQSFLLAEAYRRRTGQELDMLDVIRDVADAEGVDPDGPICDACCETYLGCFRVEGFGGAYLPPRQAIDSGRLRLDQFRRARATASDAEKLH